MKKFTWLVFLLSSFFVHAQDSIRSRIILIGDAGEYGKKQAGVITDAAAHILKNKTTVFYLGDNRPASCGRIAFLLYRNRQY